MTDAVPGRFAVGVLGPISLRSPAGEVLTPPGALPRRLLALLVLRRGRTVTVDAAIEVLWPDERPGDPVAALHNHVSRLRRLLPGVIESVPGGYRLDAALVEVDADRLAAALSEDSALLGDDGVGEILARWHGPAYPELEELDEARAESVRADELRVRALERVAAERLAAGDTDGLAAELRALVDEHPLRERPRALLMEALTATGRHADALSIYDEFRRLLADELGVEPSPALAARHREILAGSGAGEWTPEARLPVPATSLVGRDELLEELDVALTVGRLVTLVGPGGVGKTRLLLALGHRAARSVADVPVVFCELARADDTTAVEAVAAALRIDVRPGTPLPERVAAVVGDAPVLLLLDNCEHVLEPVAELVDLLVSRCPGLRIVATSRERLRVAGEQVRTVLPLTVGGAEAPATRLFVERAVAAAGDFDVDDETLDRVAHVVARLDGLPLAIELAAARLHSHELEEIAAGLDRRFDFLTSGYRTSSRHGSLSAAVSWSYDLLDASLQRSFAELSVFTGPFELSAAAAVCGLSRIEAGERLSRLVERSLVMRYPGRRYVLLESLRVYGAEQLDTLGDREEVGRRHAAFMVSWAEAAARDLKSLGTAAVSRIDEVVPELRRALDWLLQHDAPESAGRIVVALLDYGLLRLRPDVLSWAELVAEADPGDRSAVAASVRAASAYAAWMAGDLEAAGAAARRARELAEPLGDVRPPFVDSALGLYQLFAGRLRESAESYGRAAAAAEEADPGYWPIPAGTEIMIRGYLGETDVPPLAAELVTRVGVEPSPFVAYAWYCAGEAVLDTEPEVARTRLQRALELADLTGAAFVTGTAGASKASLDVRMGEYAEAADAYRRLIPHWRRAGMWSTQWVMLRSIAVLLEHLGRHRDSAVLEGAVRAATGPALAGADEVTLSDLGRRLRTALGDEEYAEAMAEGAALTSDALLDHALRAL